MKRTLALNNPTKVDMPPNQLINQPFFLMNNISLKLFILEVLDEAFLLLVFYC